MNLQKVANPELESLMNFREEQRLAMQELESLERSFEAAQHTMDQIKSQISKVRNKMKEVFYFEEGKSLYRCKKKIRTLKQKIPYSLLYPPSSTKTKTKNQDVFQHPRDGHVLEKKNTIRDEPFYFDIGKYNDDFGEILACNRVYRLVRYPSFGLTREAFEQRLHNLPHEYCIPILECLMCFPQHMIIKMSVFEKSFDAQSELPSDSKYYDDAMKYLVEHSYVTIVHKCTSLSIAGYWIHPLSYRVLQDYFRFRSTSAYKESLHFSPCPSKEQEVLYSGKDSIIENVKSVKVLLLGKWRRQLPASQHIEVEDPGLFYQGLEKLTEVKYISLRGISMITEIPQFITKLKKLKILDCKECHDLETIPNNINKLWRTLTHLDISECFLLDHMPPALSGLIHLEVLKGFHVGEPSQKHKSCTLHNLTKLSKLEKLHIITSVKGFPSTGHLTDLQKFESLNKLTITWRLTKTRDDKSTTSSATTARRALARKDTTSCAGDQEQFSFHLDKLDLRCVPSTVTREWLNPDVFKGLKRLYIRGGDFFYLGQRLEEPEEEHTSVIAEEKQWTVLALRLKYLSELWMDKSEVDSLFPELMILEKVDCPNLTSFAYNITDAYWY